MNCLAASHLYFAMKTIRPRKRRRSFLNDWTKFIMTFKGIDLSDLTPATHGKILSNSDIS